MGAVSTTNDGIGAGERYFLKDSASRLGLEAADQIEKSNLAHEKIRTRAEKRNAAQQRIHG